MSNRTNRPNRPSVPRESLAVFSPLYRQIRALLERRLDEGEWKPGEMIPSEIELAARFQVSQGTVRKAIDELAAENLLTRHQGKGTFVATHHAPKAQFRFLRVVPDAGERSVPQSRFLGCRRLRAPVEIARALQMKNGDTVVHLKRLLSFQSEPIVLEEIWLPGVLFRGLTAERLGAYKGPLYGLFESEFGIHMIRAEESIRAVAAEKEAAQLLEIAGNAPLLRVDRVSFTYGERPVEVRRGLYVTARYHYRNTLS